MNVPVPLDLLREIDAALMRGRSSQDSKTRKTQDRLIRLIRDHYEPFAETATNPTPAVSASVVITEEVPGCEPHWYINLPAAKGEARATAWFERHEQAASFCKAAGWTFTTEHFEP